MSSKKRFRLFGKWEDRFSFSVRLTFLVTFELIICIWLAIWITALLNRIFHVNSEFLMMLDVLVVSLLIGVGVTGVISRLFLEPVTKLCEAMKKVADGDLSVRLEPSGNAREIREIYSGFDLMVQELSATEILQTDFLSNVSHEFKTPINAIEGYTTLLQDCGELDAEHKQYVEKILFNTRRLSQLVGNILLLSKIDNRQILTNQTTFSLDEQIRQSIVALEPAWSPKDIEFDVELDSVEYTGSENLLYHVWDNLIGNAVKFDPQCGLVRIRLREDSGHIIFTVEDSGPGIPEEAIKHIFDKFYQADSSHKEDGNGLGLALVKRILDIIGGEISVKNLNGGCGFTVVLKSVRSTDKGAAA